MTQLLPGTPVRARGLDWEVVSAEPAGGQTRYRLRCTDGGLRGKELDLLSPFETVAPVARDLDPVRAGRLATWRLYHDAFLLEQQLEPQALLAVEPGRLDLAPYQLVPVVRALEMTRPRILLADGVGLGKTIEAGLVLAELIARRRAHRILIVSPAGPLLEQWRTEMRVRFGLRFQLLDADSLQEIRYSNELGANPFDHAALGLISIDFAKQEKVLQDLERATFDVIVIDEAHHCTRLGTAGDRDDSLRRRLAEVLARQADALLLLTATPHDGYDPHFASLIELLDPSLVDGRGDLRGEAYRRHVVRRLKHHVRNPLTGEELFPRRIVTPCKVAFGPASHPRFARLQQALLALVAPRLRKALRQKQYPEVLAYVALLKRSVSTAAACRETLAVVRDRLVALKGKGAEAQEARRERLRTLRDYRRRLERYGTLSWDEEQDQAALEAEELAADLLESGAEELARSLADEGRALRRGRERLDRLVETVEGLEDLVALASEAIPEDPKPAALLEQVQAIRAAEPSANILVYTEYTDSQEAVVSFLRKAISAGHLGGEVVTISGRDPEAVRIATTARFSKEDGLVLVSTDASAEGLNLHHRCHYLLHLELPYNPNRLEQRNGRIDRYGQANAPDVRYLYLSGTFEERLLLRLVAKYERQRARLTFVPNTLGLFGSEASPGTVRLLEGIADEQATLFQSADLPGLFTAEPGEDPAGAASRELLAEVERAMAGFEKAAKLHAWLAQDGLGAGEDETRGAEKARERGEKLGSVQLLAFVREAVEVDGGHARSAGEGIWELRLPPGWEFGLDETPGWEPETRTLRITHLRDLTADAEKRPLAFAGRTHPVVRRAIERVRNRQFGADGGLVDTRVSAAMCQGPEPQLLVTMACAVDGGEGREYERILAARYSEGHVAEVFLEPGEWTALASPDHAVPTKGVWENHFAGWGVRWREPCREAVRDAFQALAEAFIKDHRARIEKERTSLASWLRSRTDELCGELRPQQTSLLEPVPAGTQGWEGERDPVARLAGFANDPRNPRPQRREAETVLLLFKERSASLERRDAVRIGLPTVVGMLMLVPQEAGA